MKKEKILIIEDEAVLLDSLSSQLDANFFVIEASDGSNGLKKALDMRPDLILLDLLLPKMSGEDLLGNLRKDPWGAHVKVIVITNLHNADIKQRMLDLDVLEYVIKSDTTLESLSEIVIKALHPDDPVYFNLKHD